MGHRCIGDAFPTLIKQWQALIFPNPLKTSPSQNFWLTPWLKYPKKEHENALNDTIIDEKNQDKLILLKNVCVNC